MWRVSRILQLSGLVDPWFYTSEGRGRGEIVHSIGEAVFMGHEVHVSPDYQGYANAMRRLWEHLQPQLICAERRLYYEDVTGRPDVIGWLPRRVGRLPAGPFIGDVKSGDRQDAHAIQLALYEWLADHVEDIRQALPEQFRELPFTRLGMYVHADGEYRLRHYDDWSDAPTAQGFLDGLRWKLAHGYLKADDCGDSGGTAAEPYGDPAALGGAGGTGGGARAHCGF